MLLVLAITVTAFLAAVAISVSLPRILGGATTGVLQERRAEADRALQDLFITSLTAIDIVLIALLGAFVLGTLAYVLSGSLLVAFAMGGLVLGSPVPILAYMRISRVARIEEQLPGAIDLVTAYARAGMTLPQALEEVAENTNPPISQELQMVVQDMRITADLGRAIESARLRIGSRSFGLVATALQVSRDKGGNLPEALERMSQSLKEIWRLEEKLKTASSEGRKAAWMISGAPIGIAAMVMVFQPDLAHALVESLNGIVILIVAAGIYGLALWWLINILRNDV